MKRLLVITLLMVAACSGSSNQSPRSPTSVPTAAVEQPTSSAKPSPASVKTWPTVLALREALTADGYELFRDVTNNGYIRWTGEDPNTAPIEILGKDDAVAEVAVTVDVEPGHDTHLEAVLAYFPAPHGDRAKEALQAVRDAIPTASPYEMVVETRDVEGGRIKVSGTADEELGKTITVFFTPG